jgi:iron complex transport system substrate-binding protein
VAVTAPDATTADPPRTGEWPFPADPTPEPRVVSTSPSGTEMLYALGVEPVGVSHACDVPAAAADLPRVEGETSAARHASVAAAREDGVHEVDAGRLTALDPDLVVSQSVCGVCAVDEPRVEAALDDDVRTVGLAARTVGDVLDCVREVGEAVGRPKRAAAVAADCRSRLDELDRATPEDGPRVAVVEWMDPLRVAGNWVPELVAAAGGRYGLVAAGERSRAVEWADLRAYAPEVLVVAPCGRTAAETRDRLDELAGRPGWSSLPAVAADRVHLLDGGAPNRWTPRLVDVAETVAGVLAA